MARETPAILPVFHWRITPRRVNGRTAAKSAIGLGLALFLAGCSANQGMRLQRHASFVTATDADAELLAAANGWEGARRDDELALGADRLRPVVERYEIEMRDRRWTVNGRIHEYSRLEVETVERGYR